MTVQHVEVVVGPKHVAGDNCRSRGRSAVVTDLHAFVRLLLSWGPNTLQGTTVGPEVGLLLLQIYMLL